MDKVIISFCIISFAKGQFHESNSVPSSDRYYRERPNYYGLYGTDYWDRSNQPSYNEQYRHRISNYNNPYTDPYNYYRPNYQNRQRSQPEYSLHPFYRPYIQYGYQAYSQNLINGGLDPKSPQVVNYEKDEDSKHGTDFNENSIKKVKDMIVVNKDYTEVVHSIDSNNGYATEEKINLKVKDDKGDYQDKTEYTKDGKEFKNMHHSYIQESNEDLHEAHKGYYDAKSKMCNFMNKYIYQMGDHMMKMACKMYMEWGDNMKRSPKWKPTKHQKSWFDSLGSVSVNKKRHRRQAEFRQGSNNKALRKEYRMLNDEERYRLHRAMNVLKNTHMDGLSMYDVFVRVHQANISPGAHFGPAFLPFHRELLLRFENALREVDASVSLPYWDSNLDYILGDDVATESILWTKDFLGNGVGDVVTGPFAYWQVPFIGSQSNNNRLLFRNLTIAPPFARTMPALMSDVAILHMLESPMLRNLTWFVSPVFESNHGAVHNWVGGVMGDIPISPSDPVFFMHHAFIDCLWEQTRKEQKKRNPDVNPEYDYPNDTEALGLGLEQPDGSILEKIEDSHHYSLNVMHPFEPLRNIDGLSNVYFDHFYSCQPSPICNRRYPQCGSRYLFCDVNSERCAPKLVLGANCELFKESTPCFQGYCCQGTCQITCQNDVTSNVYDPRDRLYDVYFG